MEVLFDLSDLKGHLKPTVLSIGNYDGMHLGHLSVIDRVKKLAAQTREHSVVLTFLNHPFEVLNPDRTPSKICTFKHKLKLLEEQGIDATILLRFTYEFSQQSAEEFLTNLYTRFPFKHLVLGHDAFIGKNREGNPEEIKKIAKKLDVQVEYLPPYKVDAIPVSSSLIRHAIGKGDFKTAEKLLGRPFTIYSQVATGVGKGSSIGFPTANIDIQGLCIPPLGVYAVRIHIQGIEYPGVANLGYAPTLRNDNKAIFEVHILDQKMDLYGQNMEVFFHQFIRPEQKFSSLQQLKEQIQLDIKTTKELFYNKE